MGSRTLRRAAAQYAPTPGIHRASRRHAPPAYPQRRLSRWHLGPQPWQTRRSSSNTPSSSAASIRHTNPAPISSRAFRPRPPTSTRVRTGEHHALRRSANSRADTSGSSSCTLPSPHRTATATATSTTWLLISSFTATTIAAASRGATTDISSRSSSAGSGAIARTDSSYAVDASITTTTTTTSSSSTTTPAAALANYAGTAA